MLGGARRISIDGRYRLLGLLGRGGMGEVHLARDEVLDRDVAVKVLAEQYSHDGEAVERFRREAKSAAVLSHPHIVPVYDLGETAHGTHYIVMEYVPGGTLKERILREGPVDAGTAAGISLQVAAALGAAHDAGVIHRDVKPENILFAGSGEAKVTDFGIARAASSPRLTQTGFALGTADYMSPEQAMGDPVGPASDLYSLGVVLYQMLAGERPFEADSPLATVVKHANEPPPRLRRPGEGDPAFPGGMDAVVGKLLAKDPADRHGSASELMADLERVMDGLGLGPDEPAKPRGVSRGASGDADVPPDPGADTVLGAAAHKKRAKGRRRRLLGGAVLSAAVILLLLGVAGALGPLGAWDGDPSPGDSAQAAPQGTEEGEKHPAQAATVDEKGEGPEAANPSGLVFVHRATPENVSDNSTYIDDPRTNGHPDAVLSVTQNWNPGGLGGTYNAHPIGVWYDVVAEKWAIANEDRAAMPDGAAFNVVVSRDPAEAAR
jgi:hypothetical protein